MKSTLVNSTVFPTDPIDAVEYEKKHGSFVTIKVGDKEYTGTARRAPYDIFSRFEGCKYAEQRAYKKYWKDVRAEKRMQLKGVERAYNMLMQTKDIDPHSKEMRQMRKMMGIINVEIAELTFRIDNVESSIFEMNEKFIKAHKKCEERKEKEAEEE